MESTTIIISLSVLILLAYVFDITAARTRIPSVILLLFCGWMAKQLAETFKLNVPELSPILPILGTIGLILIVFEGSLELEIERSKFRLIGKSFLTALIPIILLATTITFFLVKSGHSMQASLSNSIPFCVISSAIAIPTARQLSAANREFVTYESSLSDILGVIFFNFIALNEVISGYTYLEFAGQLLAMAAISFVATLTLSFLLSKIDHHVKFAPILFFVILVYGIAKLYHLPALVFILVLGLFLGNLDKLRFYGWMKKLEPENLEKEVNRFKDIVTEATFLVRASFFLLFGFMLSTEEVFNLQSLPLAGGITVTIFLIRAIQLKIFHLDIFPLLFIAPRGLITVLLFLSIPPGLMLPEINNSLVIQVVILSTLVMTLGTIIGERKTTDPNIEAGAEVI